MAVKSVVLCPDFSILYLVSFTPFNRASTIRFPPMSWIFLISPPSSCNAPTSSPPPIDVPVIKMLGTVLRPVKLINCACNCAPSGCRSSSTMNGAGVMAYKLNMDFAFLLYGQKDLEKITTIGVSSVVGANRFP